MLNFALESEAASLCWSRFGVEAWSLKIEATFEAKRHLKRLPKAIFDDWLFYIYHLTNTH